MFPSSTLAKYKVSDIAAPIRNALVRGPFGSNLVSRDYVPVGVPVIRGQNMGMGKWVSGEFVYVTPEKASTLAANIAQPGDLIITQRGTLGQVAIIPSNQFKLYVISQSQMKLTPDPRRANVLYLYYFFCHPASQEYIHQSAIQTGVPHTNLETLRSTPLVLPSLSEQQQIAEVLGSLDDKIELNHQMNRTLEEIAQTIFRSWFIDFDPVRAKAEGREPYGMDSETVALFPDSLEDSELGPVPLGWVVQPIEDAAQLHRNTVKPMDYPDEKFEHYSLPAFDAGGMPVVEPGMSIRSAKMSVPKGSILLSKLNPRIPRVWLPREESKLRQICSTEFLVVRPETKTEEMFLYLLFRSPVFGTQFESLVTGTSGSHQRVTGKSFRSMIFARPPSEIIEAFGKQVRPLLDLFLNNREENVTVTDTRDPLLPKLISGEIQASEVTPEEVGVSS